MAKSVKTTEGTVQTSGSTTDSEVRTGRGCRACVRVLGGTAAEGECFNCRVCAIDGRTSRGGRADVRFANVTLTECDEVVGVVDSDVH